MNKIEFTACLKPTGKAIKISSENDAEVTLSVSAMDIANVVKLAGLSGKAFSVLIQEIPSA